MLKSLPNVVDTIIVNLNRTTFPNPAWGLARTLLALSTAITLIFTSTNQLWFGVGEADGTGCVTWLQDNVSYFCLASPDIFPVIKWISIIVLLVVASGFFPKWTAVPHWWVTFSYFSSSNTFDGGDQVAIIATLLFVPISLIDKRLNHFQSAQIENNISVNARIVAHVALALIWVQTAVIYLQSSVAKLYVDEWLNGTAVYYWSQHPVFGFPPWAEFASNALQNGAIVAPLTWGTILVELAVAISLLASVRIRAAVCALTALLHIGIAILLGLPSFSLVMLALLLLYVVRPGDSAWYSARGLRVFRWLVGEEAGVGSRRVGAAELSKEDTDASSS